MKIEDFKINIKKFDREKNVVYINLLVCNELEIRGWTIRYTETKYSPDHPIWIVNPPSVKGRNKKYYWIAELKNPSLWQMLEKRILNEVKSYTNLL